MSSHREAPEISKDPVADSTDVYAFVSPDRPGPGHADRQLRPPPGARRRPNFYEFGDDVLYEINIDNDGDGCADITLPVPVHQRDHQPEHLPLQHRSDQHADQPELEPPPDLLGDPSRPRPGSHLLGLGRSRARPATSVRCPRPTTPASPTRPSPSSPPAPTSSPGSGPRASTSTSAPSSTSATCAPSSRTTPPSDWPDTGLGHMAAGVNSTAGVNVHSIAIQVPIAAAHRGRHASRQGDRPDRRARRLDDRQPPEGPDLRGHARGECQLRPLHPGLTPRQPVGQRGADPHGDQGLLELPGPQSGQPVRHPRTPTPSWPGCCPCSTRACSPNSPPSTRRPPPGPTCWPSCSPASPPASCPGSRTTPGPARPTCYGSTSPSRHRLGGFQPGPGRRRPGRVPERPTGVRRRRHHRDPGHRRCHPPAGRPGVQADAARPGPSPWDSPRARPT